MAAEVSEEENENYIFHIVCGGRILTNNKIRGCNQHSGKFPVLETVNDVGYMVRFFSSSLFQ